MRNIAIACLFAIFTGAFQLFASEPKNYKFYSELFSQGFDSFEVDEATGCFDFEISENDECSIEIDCETEDECKKVEDAYDDFIDAFNESAELELDEDFNYKEGHASSEEMESLDSLETLYEIKDGKLELIKGNDKDEHHRIYAMFKNLVPKKYSEYIKYFSPQSDGLDETLGEVRQHPENSADWILIIDQVDFSQGDSQEVLYTMIHEYAHILTLNKDQLDYGVEKDNCSTYYLDEGCSHADSYINKFFASFWAGAIDTERKSYERGENAGDDQGLAKFYAKHQNKFVTEYAATNSAEDFAETFVKFVLAKKPESSKDLIDKKLLHFFADKSLVSLKKEIMQNLSAKKWERSN